MSDQEIEYPYELKTEKREKAKGYSKQKLYSGFIGGTIVPLLALASIYFSSWSHYLDTFALELVQGSFLDVNWIGHLIYVFLLFTILYLVQIPISYYSGFIVERKYDLSNLTLGEWGKDQVKSYILYLLLGIPLTMGAFVLGRTFPTWWWIIAGLLLFIILGVLSNISHLLILPLFYETTKVNNEDLREDLVTLCEEHGVPLEKVVQIKFSEKTEKANAAFAGMGKTKRLFLTDTLLDKFHGQEIKGIVAHELGHYLHKDIWRLILVEGLLIFPILFITHLIFNQWATFTQFYHLPLFLLIVLGLQELSTPLTNAFSRHRERNADRFTFQTIPDVTAMISAFKRLSDIDLAEMNPKRIVKILFYDHPPLKARIQSAKTYQDD